MHGIFRKPRPASAETTRAQRTVPAQPPADPRQHGPYQRDRRPPSATRGLLNHRAGAARSCRCAWKSSGCAKRCTRRRPGRIRPCLRPEATPGRSRLRRPRQRGRTRPGGRPLLRGERPAAQSPGALAGAEGRDRGVAQEVAALRRSKRAHRRRRPRRAPSCARPAGTDAEAEGHDQGAAPGTAFPEPGDPVG